MAAYSKKLSFLISILLFILLVHVSNAQSGGTKEVSFSVENDFDVVAINATIDIDLNNGTIFVGSASPLLSVSAPGINGSITGGGGSLPLTHHLVAFISEYFILILYFDFYIYVCAIRWHQI